MSLEIALLNTVIRLFIKDIFNINIKKMITKNLTSVTRFFSTLYIINKKLITLKLRL